MAEIKVITIGRHYCAGGSTIGKLVAEKLGIPCYDREIIDMAAQKSGIAMSEIQKYEEAALSILKTPINLFSKEKEYPITEKISVRSAQLRSTTSPRTRWKQGSKSMTKNVPTITIPTPTKSGEIFQAMICALTAASLATKCAPR